MLLCRGGHRVPLLRGREEPDALDPGGRPCWERRLLPSLSSNRTPETDHRSPCPRPSPIPPAAIRTMRSWMGPGQAFALLPGHPAPGSSTAASAGDAHRDRPRAHRRLPVHVPPPRDRRRRGVGGGLPCPRQGRLHVRGSSTPRCSSTSTAASSPATSITSGSACSPATRRPGPQAPPSVPAGRGRPAGSREAAAGDDHDRRPGGEGRLARRDACDGRGARGEGERRHPGTELDPRPGRHGERRGRGTNDLLVTSDGTAKVGDQVGLGDGPDEAGLRLGLRLQVHAREGVLAAARGALIE